MQHAAAARTGGSKQKLFQTANRLCTKHAAAARTGFRLLFTPGSCLAFALVSADHVLSSFGRLWPLFGLWASMGCLCTTIHKFLCARAAPCCLRSKRGKQNGSFYLQPAAVAGEAPMPTLCCCASGPRRWSALGFTPAAERKTRAVLPPLRFLTCGGLHPSALRQALSLPPPHPTSQAILPGGEAGRKHDDCQC